MLYRLIICCLLLTMVVGVAAQTDDTCPVIAKNALEQVDALCSSLQRNQACYGNITLESVPQAGVENFEFDSPGDIVDVMDIQSLRLKEMQQPDQWGVAVLRLQANLPDSLPGQNVTMLLFGNVELEVPAQVPPMQASITASGNVNVREKPATSASIVASLAPTETITITGRNIAGDWLRITLEGDVTGWIATFLVALDGDLEALPVVSDSTTAMGPMQAFYFRSGVGDAPCMDVPGSGLLIQTPKGAGQIEFTINGVNLALGSTAFVQAAPGKSMDVYVVEGEATVTAQGISRAAPQGTVVTVPMDESLLPDGIPNSAIEYATEIVQSLPAAHLPEPVEVAAPFTPPPFAIGECTASSADHVPIYTQPSTDAPILINLGTWKNIYPYGQVLDENGMLWWQVNVNGWVLAHAFHVVEGACADLPTVDPDDPQETESTRTLPGYFIYDLDHCSTRNNEIIRPGKMIHIQLDAGGAPTRAEAQAQNALYQPIIEVDGVPAFNLEYIISADPHEAKFNINYGGGWIATAGTHVFYGCCSYMQREETCLVTVEPE